jgi:NAD(P)-dependent dehydrogenase (short-subunit alcohol dehydrogenase family)
MQLKEKTALIAGAGRNNGKAIALTFAREGANLVLVARKMGYRLNEVAHECQALGAQVLPLLADLSEPEDANRVVQSGLQRFTHIDVLVSAIGIRPHMDFWEYSAELWLKVFSINLHSTFYLAKAVAPSMIERKRGSIIALGAGSSLTVVRKGGALEAACKHGLYGLIKALALELGPYGVRANLLVLGSMENERTNPEWYQEPGHETFTSAALAATPLRRKGTNQEAAEAALFLASEQSSFITGDRVNCTGGRFM